MRICSIYRAYPLLSPAPSPAGTKNKEHYCLGSAPRYLPPRASRSYGFACAKGRQQEKRVPIAPQNIRPLASRSSPTTASRCHVVSGCGCQGTVTKRISSFHHPAIAAHFPPHRSLIDAIPADTLQTHRQVPATRRADPSPA